MTGGTFTGAGAVTVIVNGLSDADSWPSLTLITILLYEPTCELLGVPVSAPVAMLKVAQAGLLLTEKEIGLPSGSLAVGWKEYALPAVTLVGGDPEITGGWFVGVGAFTVIENAGNDAESWPSLTLMMMFPYVAT
jgi:hypothetical protein